MPTVQDFQAYIRRTKMKAADQGVKFLELSAEGIHKCVAPASLGYRDIELCREAMSAEAHADDKILPPGNGKTANLTISYDLSR